MTWVTTIVATYDDGPDVNDVAQAQQFFEKAQPDAIWTGCTVTFTKDFGARSKYAAVRPTIELLRSIFDPVATDDYYQPWPIEINVRTVWEKP